MELTEEELDTIRMALSISSPIITNPEQLKNVIDLRKKIEGELLVLRMK